MKLTGTIADRTRSSATQNLPSSLRQSSQAVTDCLQRYKDANNFALTFTPQMQKTFCADRDRVFGGYAPTLATMRKAFGDDKTEAWITCQLKDLSEFAGCQDKITIPQMVTLAQIITATYPYIKATEFMLFCWQMKSGKYGKFYGTVDPMVIASALRTFDIERRDDLARIENQRRKAQQKKDDQQHQPRVDAFRAKCEYYGVDPLAIIRNADLFNGSLTPEEARQKLRERENNAKSSI